MASLIRTTDELGQWLRNTKHVRFEWHNWQKVRAWRKVAVQIKQGGEARSRRKPLIK